MPTPHINAADGDFAPAVLMPGDPLRAKRIAEQYFESPRLVTEVRGILGYTGTVNGRPISVMGSGMGMPSLTIYATELIRHYGVQRIVRVGTMGGASDVLSLGDVVAASGAHTDSAIITRKIPGATFSATPTFSLLRAAVEHAEANAIPLHVGTVFTTDVFYQPEDQTVARLLAHGTLAIEMEAAGLYAIGAELGIETLTVGTISDYVHRSEEMTSEQRETTFGDAVRVAIAALQS